jgi:hypothetical protein
MPSRAANPTHDVFFRFTQARECRVLWAIERAKTCLVEPLARRNLVCLRKVNKDRDQPVVVEDETSLLVGTNSNPHWLKGYGHGASPTSRAICR